MPTAPYSCRKWIIQSPTFCWAYLLGKLSQCAYASVKAFFQATLSKNQAVPGVIVAIQTFGDMVNFHPHLHAIVSDGLFTASGWLYGVHEIDLKKLELLFRHKVLTMLRREGKIEDALIKKLLGWRHSGFSIHHQGALAARTSRDGRSWLSISCAPRSPSRRCAIMPRAVPSSTARRCTIARPFVGCSTSQYAWTTEPMDGKPHFSATRSPLLSVNTSNI